MPDSGAFNTYGEYMTELWERAERQPDPHTVSRLVAAESCWLRVPDAEAAAAKPDFAAIDGWAERIEGTKALGRVLESPRLSERIKTRDAEGLMADLRAELTPRSRGVPEPQRERAVERQAPRKKAPGEPTR